MKKLSLNSLLIICLSICLILGVYLAFDYNLGTTENVADATTTYDETWSVIKDTSNNCIQFTYTMHGYSIYTGYSGALYFIVWETGTTDGPITCKTGGDEDFDDNVSNYSFTSSERIITYTLNGSDYLSKNLSYGIFVYDADPINGVTMQSKPSDWPNLIRALDSDSTKDGVAALSGGVDFTSPIASSVNDTYTSSTTHKYIVDGEETTQQELVLDTNPSIEASYVKTDETATAYGTLIECFNSIKTTGGTVTLLKNLDDLSSIINVGDGTCTEKYILELGSHTITVYDTYSAVFNVYGNFVIHSSSSGKITTYRDTVFLFKQSDKMIATIEIQDGTYKGRYSVFKTDEGSTVVEAYYNKLNITIENGNFDTENYDSACIFDLYNASTCTKTGSEGNLRYPTAHNYSTYKDTTDILIKGGMFIGRNSIFKLTMAPAYETYNAGRKVEIYGGNFTSNKYIVECDYHCNFTIGSENSPSEPDRTTFYYSNSYSGSYAFCNDKSYGSNSVSSNTFNFNSCLVRNALFSYKTTDSSATYKYFTDMDWCVDFSKYKDGGLWHTYYDYYYTYKYAFYKNFKLDFRDGNEPEIIPSNDTLLKNLSNSNDARKEFLNPKKREIVNSDAPLQYFVCWSKNIDDEGFNKDGSKNGNMITRNGLGPLGLLAYEYDDFFKIENNNYTPIARCYYAVWSTTDINSSTDNDVRYNEDYSNITPVWTQTLHWGTSAASSNNGSISEFVKIYDSSYDSNVLTINENIVIDVRNKENNSLECIKISASSGTYKIVLGADLSIYLSSYIKNAELIGIYTSLGIDFSIESKDSLNHNLNIAVNNYAEDNSTGQTYGMRCYDTIKINSANINLKSLNNAKYTGISVGNQKADKYLYLNNSNINFSIQGTTTLSNVTYIAVPALVLTYTDNLGSQINCNIIDPTKLSFKPCFDFTSTASVGLYSETLSPYVDNVSSSIDSLSIVKQASESIYILYNESNSAATTLYHYDLSKALTISNVPKISSVGDTAKYASFSSVAISYDKVNSYYLLDDYIIEDSLYKYGMNHNPTINLNGHNFYINHTINVGSNTLTFYGEGNIYGGVSTGNTLFKGDTVGSVRIYAGLDTKMNDPVNICLYFNDCIISDGNINFYVGNEFNVAKGRGLIDITSTQLNEKIHIMSGWMKYDVYETDLFEDGTYTIFVEEANRLNKDYPYNVRNYRSIEWNGSTYSCLNKAYKAFANSSDKSNNVISLKKDSVLDKQFKASNYDFTINLSNYKLNLKGNKITASNCKISFVGKNSSSYGEIDGSKAMFEGNMSFEYCKLIKSDDSDYMFIGSELQLVSLKSCDIQLPDKFSTAYLNVEINGGFYDIKIASQTSRISIYNGYFVEDISKYVSHLDGVHIYTKNISEKTSWDDATIYTCQFFSENVVNVYYASTKKTVSYLSLTAAIKATNEDSNETSYKFTLLSDAYLFPNYLTDANKTYIEVLKNITIVTENTDSKYNIHFDDYYLVIQGQLDISNAKIYGNKFFYLNDVIGNITITLTNCEIIQSSNAQASDCIFNTAAVTKDTTLTTVIINNNLSVSSEKGKLNLGQGKIDYQLLGDGKIYFDVKEFGARVDISELTGNKEIYYIFDTSSDVFVPEDNSYLSIGATNKDYENGLSTKYIYKTISNPLDIIISSNYSVTWYDEHYSSFTLNTAQELLGFAAICNGYVYGVDETFVGKEIHLGADINLENINWQPIAQFDGSFYGDGHKITNLTIDCMTKDGLYYGLFGAFSGPTFKDLEVSGTINISTYISSYQMLVVGGLIGYSQTNLINCVSNITITVDCPRLYESCQYISIGGMVGYAKATGIYNSLFDSTLTTTLPSEFNEETIFVGTMGGDFASSQIANSYVSKASSYYMYGAILDTEIYNSYSIDSSNKFSVFEDNVCTVYSDYIVVTKLLDDTVFDFDTSKLYASGFELYYWNNNGTIPIFYDGPYFKLVVNGKLIKTCDEGFSYEPEKEGFTFEKWLRVNNDYTTAVDKHDGHYDATCFNSRTYYYAYFQALNEITDISITNWTYGEDANKPFAKSLFGTILYQYSVKDSGIYTDTVPTQAGSYTLKAYVIEDIEYHAAEKTIDFEIKKASYNMSKIKFTDKSFTYDGTKKQIKIYGFLPSGVSVSYTSDKEEKASKAEIIVVDGEAVNELTNVGSIAVNAVFTIADTTNYNAIESMSASLTIIKATFDTSSFRFDDKYYTFDSLRTNPYTIEIIGTLPTGLSVTYENNTITNGKEVYSPANKCASKVATAIFTYDKNNYNAINDEDKMYATLYVNTNETIDISHITLDSATYTYSKGTTRSIEINLHNGSMPGNVSVTYTNNNQENAGTYYVVAHFTIGTEIKDDNGKLTGYEVIDAQSGVKSIINPMNDLVAKLVINKATYDMQAAISNFQNASHTYDPNTTWTLEIDEQYIPTGVTVTYSDNTLKDVGSKVVEATFTVDENNYNTIDSIYATLTVTKATYDMSGVVFNNASFVYDGTLKTIKLDPSSVIPEGVTVKYSIKESKYRTESDIKDEAGATTVGSLYVYAVFTGDSKNYEAIQDVKATITITQATYDISNVFFKNTEYVYDGKIHSIYLTDKDGNPAQLPDGLNVYYSTNTLGKAGQLKVTATFDGDFINYKSLDDKTATLTITKATYDMSGVSFNNVSYVFDNESKTIVLDGTLPKGVTVTYKNNKGLQVGTYKATATFKVDERNYNLIDQMQATLTITKATYDMSNIKFEDTALIYNGEYQTIYISGTLPEGVTVEYQHNSLREACPELEAVATFKILDTLNYNAIEPMRAKFVILKATYDMSNITFADISLTYDGTEKKIAITGDLPEGVTVSYINNVQINAGEYEATAIFSGDFDNYNDIENMVAKLKVKKATHNMSNIIFTDVSYPYDGSEKVLKIEQELPDGVRVEYSTNSLTNSGSILVIATFTLVDTENYNEIEPIKATLTIEKLTYDMSDVVFENKTYVYDGTEKKIEVFGNLPLGVQPVYSYNRQIDVGVLTVTAAFRGDTINHNAIPQMTATLTITKATYDLSSITFEDTTVLYDGNEHIIEISGVLPTGVSVQYENNSNVEPGVYTVKATVSGDTHNYYSKEYTATLTIKNTQLKNDESESKSIVVVLADEGFTKDVSLNTGYSTEQDKYSNLVTRDTKVLGYYSVTLYMVDETGNTIEYQPNECTESGTIKVKLLLNGIDLREVEKIYHVHKNGTIEEIAFNMDMFDGQYITLELTSLSDFVFVAHDDTYKKTMIMNIVILVVIILVGLYLINTILYIIWKKTGFALLKFMVPLYRFKNKLFFKIQFNDKEILDQDNNAGEKKEKEKKKPTNKNRKKNKRKNKKKNKKK